MRIAVTALAFIASCGFTAYVMAVSVEHFERRPTRARFLFLLLLCAWMVLVSGADLYFLTREINERF